MPAIALRSALMLLLAMSPLLAIGADGDDANADNPVASNSSAASTSAPSQEADKSIPNKSPTKKSVLKPFTTDGCSLWVDGTLEHPNLWRHCCVAHDKAYWIGGTADDRKAADVALEVCVKEAQGAAMADYMYYMVRWGGHPDWLTPYRWGYGWNYLNKGAPREYKTPTEDEQKQIDRLLLEAEKYIAADEIKHPATKKISLTK